MLLLSYWPAAALAPDGSATTKSVLPMLQRHSCFLPPNKNTFARAEQLITFLAIAAPINVLLPTCW